MLLKGMVGTRRLELLTSTVSKNRGPGPYGDLEQESDGFPLIPSKLLEYTKSESERCPCIESMSRLS
jgi:hypothetical protein